MNRLIVTLVASALMMGVAAAQAPGEKLKTVQLVLLKKGPNIADAAKPEGRQILGQHVAHLYEQNKSQTFLAAGPLVDQGEIQGLIIVAAPTIEKANEIEGADPAVKAGIFAMETLPLMLETWVFGSWAEMGKFERLCFGFLKSGPARSQDKAAAEELQRQHLAYMEEQHAQGKLVSAGPFTNDMDRRGIVVYRVANLEDARQIAAGDPMVKAGRLTVELHPWQVPVGALKAASK